MLSKGWLDQTGWMLDQDSGEAMARALDLAGVEGGVIVTGSITLVAEVLDNES
jgi:hypothetical protein